MLLELIRKVSNTCWKVTTCL